MSKCDCPAGGSRDPLDEVAALHAQFLTPKHLRKGKGGRQPAVGASALTDAACPLKPACSGYVSGFSGRSSAVSTSAHTPRSCSRVISRLVLHLQLDPRRDPRVDPARAKRVLANRLSAARSKMKARSQATVSSTSHS